MGLDLAPGVNSGRRSEKQNLYRAVAAHGTLAETPRTSGRGQSPFRSPAWERSKKRAACGQIYSGGNPQRAASIHEAPRATSGEAYTVMLAVGWPGASFLG